MNRCSECNSLPTALQDLVLINASVPMIISRNGEIVEGNDSCARLLGYAQREDIIGLRLASFLTPESVHAAEQRVNQQIAGCLVPDAQIYDGYDKDGLPLRIEAATLVWPTYPLHFISVFRDITSQEKDVDILKESRKLYRILAETLPVGVMLSDPTGKNIFVNEQMAQMTGYSVEELLKGVWLCHPDDKESLELFEDALIHLTSRKNYETRLVRKDGKMIWFSISWQPVLDGNGNMEYLHVVFSDIDNLKQSEYRISKINRCILSFGANPTENINKLTALCGELLGAICALYNRLEGNLLYSCGKWQAPADYNPIDKPEGHICFDVIREASDEVFVIRNLHESRYAQTDPNVKAYNLKTYIGKAVTFGGVNVGSLCVVYQDNVMPSDDDKRIISLIASAIGVEEERRSAQDEIQSSQELLDSVIENILVGVCVLDSSFRVQLWNRGMEKISDIPRHEILGKNLFECIPVAANTGLEEQFRNVLQTGRYSVITDYKVADLKDPNNLFYLNIKANPLKKCGNVTGITVVVTNTTDHKKSEEALRESESRYRGLIESQQDLIVRTSPDGKFTFVNDVYCKLFGKPADELLDQSFVPLVHEEDLEKTMAALEELKVPPYRCTVEQRALTVHGWRWLAWEDCAIRNKAGEMVEIQAVGRDITERKRIEDAIHESEERFRTIYNSANALILAHDLNWRVIYMNPYACKTLGYEEGEMLGKDIRGMLSASEYERAEPERQQLAATPDLHIEGFEQYYYKKSGGQILINWNIVALKDASGDFIGILGVGQDVTERKQAEEELLKAHSDLERSYNLQREFLNNVTHEVRTPLTAVKGYAEMLLEGVAGQINEEQAALLLKVLASSDHLLEIVGGVLQMSKLKSGSASLRPQICNPKQIAARAVQAIFPQAQRKGLIINLKAENDNCASVYDEEKLTMILTNLLSNAVKFTEHGQVDVILDCRPEGVDIVIADTGLGIPEAEMEAIFDEFQQLPFPGKHKPVGFGLGLTIVAAMVDAIGATLTVSSVEHVGTAFTLHVPVLEVNMSSSECRCRCD